VSSFERWEIWKRHRTPATESPATGIGRTFLFSEAVSDLYDRHGRARISPLWQHDMNPLPCVGCRRSLLRADQVATGDPLFPSVSLQLAGPRCWALAAAEPDEVLALMDRAGLLQSRA